MENYSIVFSIHEYMNIVLNYQRILLLKQKNKCSNYSWLMNNTHLNKYLTIFKDLILIILFTSTCVSQCISPVCGYIQRQEEGIRFPAHGIIRGWGGSFGSTLNAQWSLQLPYMVFQVRHAGDDPLVKN